MFGEQVRYRWRGGWRRGQPGDDGFFESLSHLGALDKTPRLSIRIVILTFCCFSIALKSHSGGIEMFAGWRASEILVERREEAGTTW